MSLLQQFGFNSHFQNSYYNFKQNGLETGRIYSIQGFKHHVITESGELEAEVSGALLNSKDTWDLPKVGDWVVFVRMESLGLIVDLLPRQNELSRKVPGKAYDKQVLVANIDYAFVVQALDNDFNIMRLQRYLHQLSECNIIAALILNKCDLVIDPSKYIEEVNSLGFDISIFLTSTQTGEGIDELIAGMESKKTYALLGSSGVGKSSLLNCLNNSKIQSTSSISKLNKKGKHTTTFRYLIQLPNGSLLIDTPGMREFGLTGETEDSAFIHPQIQELAKNCKFSDCQHLSEPGCAVIKAANSGDLPEIVYRSFLKLSKEQERFATNLREKRMMERQFGKIAREAQNHKKKWKS